MKRYSNELWELKRLVSLIKAYTLGAWLITTFSRNVASAGRNQAGRKSNNYSNSSEKSQSAILTATIKQRGPQTADELATLFGTTSRKSSFNAGNGNQQSGRLIRVTRNGKFRYCMPDDNLPAEPKAASVTGNGGKAFPQPAGVALPAPEAAKTETVADIVQPLPSFTGEPIRPGFCHAAFGNRELRRAKIMSRSGSVLLCSAGGAE